LTPSELELLVGSPTPRVSTPRPYGPSRGVDLVDLAVALGEPLLPWQQHVADAAHVVDDRGRWAHSTCGVLVSRQNGKSHLLRLRIIAGMLLWDERLILATAQSREVALETFRLVVETMESVPWLSRQVKRVSRTNGKEELELLGGARFKIVAPSEGGARGYSADLVIIDEARQHRTTDAYAALVYTTQARPNPQVWAVSNAGDAGSTVLNNLRDQALQAIANGTPGPLGWWEWSAEPGAAIDDTDAWVAANPSLGHLVRPEALMARVKSDPVDIVRTEMLCQWVETMDSPFPSGSWADCYHEGLEIDPSRPTFFAIDVTPDRRDAALIAVQQLDDEAEQLAAFVLDTWHADDTIDDRKVAGQVAKRARDYYARVVAFDRWTAAGIASRLAQVGIPVGDVSGSMFTQACDELLGAIVSKRLQHAGQELLTEQVAAAARKQTGDGGWRIVRRQSAGPVCAAVALAMATHHAVRMVSQAEIIVG
jgi:phage terminase large subunit-like protein